MGSPIFSCEHWEANKTQTSLPCSPPPPRMNKNKNKKKCYGQIPRQRKERGTEGKVEFLAAARETGAEWRSAPPLSILPPFLCLQVRPSKHIVGPTSFKNNAILDGAIFLFLRSPHAHTHRQQLTNLQETNRAFFWEGEQPPRRDNKRI